MLFTYNRQSFPRKKVRDWPRKKPCGINNCTITFTVKKDYYYHKVKSHSIRLRCIRLKEKCYNWSTELWQTWLLYCKCNHRGEYLVPELRQEPYVWSKEESAEHKEVEKDREEERKR